jgi:hypothetical protein
MLSTGAVQQEQLKICCYAQHNACHHGFYDRVRGWYSSRSSVQARLNQHVDAGLVRASSDGSECSVAAAMTDVEVRDWLVAALLPDFCSSSWCFHCGWLKQ